MTKEITDNTYDLQIYINSDAENRLRMLVDAHKNIKSQKQKTFF